MKGRRKWVLLAAALVLLTGCRVAAPARLVSGGPVEPASPAEEERAEPTLRGARAALQQFLDARVTRDYRTVYRLLSRRTRMAYTEADLSRFFRSYEAYAYGEIGSPQVEEAVWVRFPVRRVEWRMSGRPPMTGEAWPFTVHYDAGRWGVALAAPLAEQALALRRAGRGPELQQLADIMLGIDPWDFRAHLQKAYAQLLTQGTHPAVASLERAYAAAPPEMRAEVTRVYADLLRSTDQLEAATEAYETTLQSVQRYRGFYEPAFAAYVRRNLAEAYLTEGRRDAALREAIHTQLLTPDDLSLYLLVPSLALR